MAPPVLMVLVFFGPDFRASLQLRISVLSHFLLWYGWLRKRFCCHRKLQLWRNKTRNISNKSSSFLDLTNRDEKIQSLSKEWARPSFFPKCSAISGENVGRCTAYWGVSGLQQVQTVTFTWHSSAVTVTGRGLWRANATPAFKKGKNKGPGSCEPLSLTSILAKVKEKLLLKSS